ncbi:MAG: ATP-dependent helicase HrpB [Myxococcales bacterium]|nr:ATP-dependent helicase HrpB [Myxococcales bacterium]
MATAPALAALPPLPIDAHLPAILAALHQKGTLVLTAEPGAGKTTRLPRAMLQAGLAEAGQILVLEPRRLAARMAARRIAQELGEDVGRRVGYQVRFENQSSRDTRILFMTEGVLLRRLVDDPTLEGVAAVLFDEFHERHLHADLALALLSKLRRAHRTDLNLVIMSATLQSERVADFLASEVIEVPGRVHPVTIAFSERKDDRPLEQRVAAAVRGLCADAAEGDVLVFLPGAAEIRRSHQALQDFARSNNIDLMRLHGDLPPREQDAAVRRGLRRKVILSTNVAESSVTIEGVVAVVDSGLARVAGHSPWSGLPTLATAPISQASAKQRAGRAGRLRAGVCRRLYTRADHDGRPFEQRPELQRSDLADARLLMAAAGAHLGTEEWLDPPPAAALEAADNLLLMLGLLDADGAITALGRRASRMPLHPRLARIALEAERRGLPHSGATLAALLSERDIDLDARARFDGPPPDLRSGCSDPLDRLERFEHAEASGFDRGRLRADRLDPGAIDAVRRGRDRLLPLLSGDDDSGLAQAAYEEALGLSLLCGFGDRVARRRRPGSDQLVLAAGGSARQAPTSVVREAELVVVLEAGERPGRGVVAQQVAAIEAEWLLELFADRIEERDEVLLDETSGRVQRVVGLGYGALTLDESRSHDADPERVADVLARHVLTRGLERFADPGPLERIERRLSHAHAQDPSLPAPDAALRARALTNACYGLHTLQALDGDAIARALSAELEPAERQRLEQLAPERIQLSGGRGVVVHYEADRPPWIASRLQDFFGCSEGPTLGGQPLTLHLLAPNQRAVQVTTDLAGFWQRHYPAIRQQLRRRYPKHAWPDDPLRAEPPPPRRPGRR